MLKPIIIIICISQVLNLICLDEFSKSFNLINDASSLSTSVCHSCPQHCNRCEDDNQCYSCQSGYFLQNAACQSNQTKEEFGCIKYDSDNNCLSCGDDYWRNVTKCVKKSEEFILKCQEWTYNEQSQEKCETAKPGYGLKSSKTEFITCAEHCDECTEAQCTKCSSNYHLSDTLTTCLINEGICKEWKNSSTEECHSCPTGYNINQNFCYNQQCKCQEGKGPLYPDCSITCPAKCSKCINSTYCTACKGGYYLSENACQDQCKENCLECTTSSNCQACKANYYLSGGNCIKCGDDCAQCDSSGCILCNSNKMLNSAKECTTQIKNNCKTTIDDTNCASCHAGYYFISSNSTCSQCPMSNCAECFDATTCTSCNEGYIFYDDGKNPPECITCTNNAKYQGTCSTDKWMKFPWTCSELTSHCLDSEQTIDIGVKTIFCQSCESGYMLKDKVCEKCEIDNCVKCNGNKSQCILCKVGYFVETIAATTEGEDDTIKCTKCIDNCNQCDSATTCLDCATDYVFNNDLTQCLLCDSKVANCKKCWKAEECNECKSGYYLSGNVCKKCPNNCSDNCYDQNYCQECSDFYYFQNPYECRSCIPHCKICDNNLTCIECGEHYILSSDKKTCMFEDECLDDVENCQSCNTEDTTKCASCVDEYYWETTICKKCLDNCKTCLNAQTCQACKAHYDLNSDKTECNVETSLENACFNIKGCIKCNSEHYSRCSYCQQGSAPNAEGNCQCGEGYFLVAGVCQVQSTDNIDFDNIDNAELSDLVSYITKAQTGTKKENNTESVLKQLRSKIDTVDSTNGQLAGTILLALAETATTVDAQYNYKEILKKVCAQEGLDDLVYYSTIAAADKFYLIANSSYRQTIYDYGFTNCAKNYLKKASPKNLTVMKFTNSEFQIKQIEISDAGNYDQFLNFTDTQIVATIDLKTYLGTEKKYFMVAQSINHDGNPFKYQQNNSVMYESKLMSVTIYSKSELTSTDSPLLQDIQMKSQTFNVTFDFEGTKCGHYDEDKLEWLADGNATGKTCEFNHTTHFVIYQEPYVELVYANYMSVLSVFGILVLLALF